MPMQISISNAIGGGGGAQGAGGSSFTNTKSIALDGVDDFVDCSNPSNLNFSADDAFSFSVWFKKSSDSNFHQIINKQLAAPSYNGYIFFIDSNKKVNFRIRESSTLFHKITDNDTHPIDTWVHYVVTYDGSRTGSGGGLNLYKNGTLLTNVTRSGNFSSGTGQSTANFAIGIRMVDLASPFQGGIDEVSVFTSELSQSNITSIYNSGVPNDISSLSPLSWWRCGDGDTAPTLTDNGSGGNNGTMTNFSTFSTDVPTASSFTNTKSIALDGVDDFCETASTYSELNGTTKATISLWVKPSLGGTEVLSRLSDSTNQSAFVYQLFAKSTGDINIQIGDTSKKAITATGVLTANVYAHILVAYDGSLSTGSRTKIFVNGVDRTSSDNTTATYLANAAHPLQIGRRDFGTSLNYDGNIDEFAIWATTDQRANVSEIYASGAVVDLNNLATAPNPTTWYRMGDGDTAPTIQDKNGSANLAMTNFSTF